MRKSMYLGYKGKIEAYIYIWFSRSTKLVYVGETNNVHGVVGRANQHIDHTTGTLYQRVYDKGYDLDKIDDFVLLSYPLPREKRYMSEETAYRISVEYLVQKNLIGNKINSMRKYTLISKVETGPYINLVCIQEIANNIVMDFLEAYNEEWILIIFN